MIPRRRASGFTLVEAVIVIALSGIVAVAVIALVTQPIEGMLGQSRRARLVDVADNALRMIGRDIHRALPNSVRDCGGAGCQSIEMLNTVDGAMYRDGPGNQAATNGPEHRLEFNRADDSWNALGTFPSLSAGTSYPYRIAISNTGQTGADAWDTASPSVMSGAGFTIQDPGASPTEHQVVLDTAFQFQHESPNQRMFVVDEAVGYGCVDTTGDGNIDSLLRYSGYAFDSSLPPSNFANGVPLAREVAGCDFDVDRRWGIATLVLLMQAPEGGALRLLHQVMVENSS